ncbi:hypothetical protein [Nostoc sp.]|uniref:hypothetical protein n=1 Tax=Nostoc sp. TaxID=1180 RepID=UPI002FF9855A
MLGLLVWIISSPQHPIAPTSENPVKSRETIAVVSIPPSAPDTVTEGNYGNKQA